MNFCWIVPKLAFIVMKWTMVPYSDLAYIMDNIQLDSLTYSLFNQNIEK